MKRFKAILITGVLLSIAIENAFTQNYLNVFNFTYFYLPVASMNNEDIQFRDISIETAIPFTCKNGNIFGVKPKYESISLNTDIDTTKNLHLQSLEFPVFALLKFKNTKWSTYIEVNAKLNSDFIDIQSNHFQIGGTLLLFYQPNKDLFWQIGLFYNQEVFGPYPMPLLGFDWKINQKNYAAVILPAYLIYERKLSAKFYTGFEMELTGESYRLGGSSYKNSYISQFGENQFSFVIEPRLFIDFYITKHLVVYAKPGYRFLQKFEQFDEENIRLVHSDYVQGEIKDCFYVEAGIAYRFRYDEESPPSVDN